ncbi:MAG: class I SAM-dependent methyltransferase, partial [Candidatus Kapaibacteriota bacterium]
NKCYELNLQIELLRANAENIPFADNYFDSAVSVATFEFIRNPTQALEEMFRVVKIGGKIVVGFINRDSPWGELYLSDEFKTNTIFKYARLFSKSEIIIMHPEELITVKETLYIPPNVDVNKISLENEFEFSKKYLPGFLVALWKKR